jgi:hypothetical protein
MMETDNGRLPSAPGYSAEPEPVPVSALQGLDPKDESAVGEADASKGGSHAQ